MNSRRSFILVGIHLRKRDIPAFHSFRRLRATRLRELGVSEGLRFWLCDQGQSISNRYSKLAENVELRRQSAARAGLGFDVLTGDPRLPNLSLPVQRELANVV